MNGSFYSAGLKIMSSRCILRRDNYLERFYWHTLGNKCIIITNNKTPKFLILGLQLGFIPLW